MQEPVRGRACENCQKWISIRFKACPFCKAEQTPLTKPGVEITSRSVLGTILAFVVIIWMFQPSGGDRRPTRAPAPSAASAPTLTDAFVMCQAFIEDRLVAPTSAKWPPRPHSQYATKTGESTYLAISYVDSQNGFGAMIRTNFSCAVRYVGNDRWHLESLQMSP